MTAAKRKPGRPPLHGESSQPYQVRLPPTVAEKLRKYGGNLSQGIVKAAAKVKE